MKKAMRIISLLILVLTIYNCAPTNYIALQDAEKGLFLDRSKEVSIQTFFNRRMDGELRTNINKNWYIVNEDSDYVYFGLLQKNNGVSMVNPFYKVNRVELDSIFPGYRSIEGKHVKAKVFSNFIKPILEEHLLNICPESESVDYNKKDYTLTKKGIEANIEFIGRCYEKKIFSAKVKATLSPSNLETLNQEIKIK